MADITMCQNEDCPIKETCYRHTATPNQYRQSAAMWEPVQRNRDGEWVCVGYYARTIAKGLE